MPIRRFKRRRVRRRFGGFRRRRRFFGRKVAARAGKPGGFFDPWKEFKSSSFYNVLKYVAMAYAARGLLTPENYVTI